MPPTWWAYLGAVLLGIAAVATSWVAVRKAQPERERAKAEAAKARADALGALSDQLDAMQKRIVKIEGELQQSRQREEEAKHRIAFLESTLPILLIADRLNDLDEGVRKVLDRLSDPLVFSSHADGGTFLWVNQPFAAVLGYDVHEVLALGWRGLIVEPDRDETDTTEAMAWDRPVEGFVNRYRRRSGGTVTFRWFASPYRKGVSLALARVENIE